MEELREELRQEKVAISTEVKSLQDTYSFYTNNSLNKQIFHINELLNSSGGTRDYLI